MATATIEAPDTRIVDAVKKVTTLATLPEVTARIVKTVEDPKSTAANLHKIIAHDPALVTRILKVVNSSFYGLPGQVGSVERAIVLLGLNAVKNISVAASLGQMFRGVKLCEGFTAKDLWRHCVAVAVASRDFAKQLKQPIADEAFLAGMIHDIGILVSLQISPERLREVCERARTGVDDFCRIEQQMIGMDHQQLGMALAEQWKFPRPCQLVAGYHHKPGALANEHRSLVAIVHAADVVACRAGEGFNLTASPQSLDLQALSSVGIDAAMIDRAVTRMPELMQQSSTLLD